MESILDFAREQSWKYKVSSNNEITTPCPFCGAGIDKFYVNINSGKWVCFKCDAKGGNLKSLKFKLGVIKKQDPVTSPHLIVSPVDIEKYEFDLEDNQEAWDYLEKSRGFSVDTIKYARLGFIKTEGQDAITIPYFDKNGVCTGIKYYFYKAPEGFPKIKSRTGSKLGFYNINNVVSDKPLVITEGEFDALSAWQCGYENVGSVPSGATSVNGWTDDLSGFSSFVLCFDNDPKGQEGALKTAAKLGSHKCSRAYPKFKDLNEYLQCGNQESIHEVFESAVPMFSPPKTDILSYVDDAIREIRQPDIERGCPSGWESLDYILGGFRFSEITILTGKTGNGKSTWGISLCGELSRKKWGWKFLIITGEDRPSKVLRKLCANELGRVPSEQELISFAHRNKDTFHILNIHQKWETEGAQLDQSNLFSSINYYIDSVGCNFIFIDHAHLFISEGEGEIREIQTYTQSLRRIVATRPVHILQCVQPTKLPQGQEKVKMSNLRGSVIWEQSCWNCITVHRKNEESHLVEFEIEKNREYGRLGAFILGFDMNTSSNYRELV